MSFTEKFKKFTSEAVEVGKKLTSDAMEKGKGLAEQGKLALDNQKQQDAIKQAKALIGAYVVDHQLLTEDDFVAAQLAAISAAYETIAANNDRIAELKTSAEEADVEVEIVCEEAVPAEPCCCEDAAPAEAEAPSAEEASAPEAAPATVTCPVCGAEVPAASRFCSLCGEKLV